MAKFYMGLILLVIILSLFGQGMMEAIAPSIAPYTTYIYLCIVAILMLLFLYESYLKHPIRKTRATVKRKHIPVRDYGITFLLPSGKTHSVGGIDMETYNLLKVGDEVMLTYKGDTAIEVVPLNKKSST